jgi:leader peptidase (prepilin peptidase)/N-methyltransferase
MQDLIGLFNNSTILFISAVGFIALLFGSFLNVVISRLPAALEKEWRQQCEEFLAADNFEQQETLPQSNYTLLGLFTPSSHCPRCDAPIKPYDNIPLLSYLLLRGKCRACHTHISLQYPIVETLTALLCMLVAWNFGVTWQTVAGCFLTCVLIVQSGIDLKHKIIPDEITIPTLWLGIIISIWSIYVASTDAIIGAVVGYIVLWVVYWVFYWVTKKEGMGYGDFKLLAMLGAWLGWQALPFIILFSSIAGSVIGVCTLLFLHKKRNFRIPFGPFLALGGWIALLWGPAINNWYSNYAGIL